MNEELTKRLRDSAMSYNPLYILSTIGIYSYLVGDGSQGFNPGMTVEQMMSTFKSLSGGDYDFQGRPNSFIGSISYNFTDNSNTPPSASARPVNGFRTIEDGESIGDPNNGVNTVWQYYRSVLVIDSSGKLSTVRLFNSPVQNSYQITPVNQNLSMYLPTGSYIAGYLVTWRIIGIDFTADPADDGMSTATQEKISKRFATM